MFKKFLKFFFAHKKLKKTTLKVVQNNLNPLFFLTAWATQTAQTEEFMLQNVAYRPTVYKTGILLFDSSSWNTVVSNVHRKADTKIEFPRLIVKNIRIRCNQKKRT